MWIPFSTVAALCVLLDVTDSKGLENDLELTFQQRSRADWEKAWHQETHSRCRESLLRHLYWACEKDIYRLTRRSSYENGNYFEQNYEYPWFLPARAKRMIRFRRNGIKRQTRSSITAECCSATGCTWEEYAEYCPTNKRITPFV